MGIFNRDKARREEVVVPASMQPEEPVNYNSVLDYLVGLSPEDFKKMTKSAEIYRKANKEVAGIIGVEDEPTTSIVTEKPQLSDDELDDMLAADKDDLAAAFIDEGPVAPKPKKAQGTEVKVGVKE